MTRAGPVLAALMLLALAPVAAQAQAPLGARPQQQAPALPPTAQEAPPPPYEPQLLRLSEILGALSWLREICGDKDGEKWRASMRALMEAEAQTEARRQRLAGAYNRGFSNYETLHRTCTPNAETIIERFLDEGGKLANEVTNRFGGG
jgi:uncharacterized protein (TIGR02301 family)